MKMKEFGPPGGRVPGAPLRFANAYDKYIFYVKTFQHKDF